MKKIITILMVLMVATSMFAYIPNKDCVKVKGNKIKYYENTDVCNLLAEEAEPKDIGLSGVRKICVEWIINKYMTVERNVDINYKFLEKYREQYKKNIEKAEKEFKIAKKWIDYIKQPGLEGNFDSLELYNYEFNNILTEEEYYLDEKIYQAYSFSRSARQYKHKAFVNRKDALISIPFTTAENWLTITKEEMLTKMKAFVEEVKQNTK